MAVEKYDLLVIGTGRSGRDVAQACAEKGWRVAIADDREYGGVCANRGCDPKKVLVSFTEIIDRAKKMKGNGITSLPKTSWKDLQKFKHQFTDAVPFVNERKLKDKGVVLYHQSPKFLDKNTLSVEGKTIEAGKVVIAAGQIPLPLYFDGAQYLLTSEDFLSLEELPKSMIFIGGGFVGMEFAHVAARMGVKVTLIHAHEKPLNNFDPDMVDKLVEASEELGIQFIFNARAHKIEKLTSGFQVSADQNGKTVKAKADLIFNAAGRVPSIDKLDLEKGQVTYTPKGVSVNENLQNTSNPNVYACGDAAASKGLPLTPLASFEAEIVIAQLLDKKNKSKIDYPAQPSVVFTFPNLASVGLSEKEAKKQFKSLDIKTLDAAKWYSPKHLNDKFYAYKILIDKKTDQIVGAHMVGAGVSESINLLAMAITHKIKVNDLKNTIFAYPTWGNDLKSMW